MPAKGLQFSVEQLNFFKFKVIVCDEFPKAMRLVFKTMWDEKFPLQPWDDSVAVHSQFRTQEARRRHEIPIGTSYKTWDCTALVKATIFAFSFKDPATGQTLNDKYLRVTAPPRGSLRGVVFPTEIQDETFALAVDQLRLLRNELSHASSTKVIDKTTFHYYIFHAKKAFQAIGYSTKNIDDISKMSEAEFPTPNVAELHETIENMQGDRCKLYCIAAFIIVLLLISPLLTLSLAGYNILWFLNSTGPSGKTHNMHKKELAFILEFNNIITA